MDHHAPFLPDRVAYDRLQRHFGEPDDCRRTFQTILWPNGFRCRKCRSTDFKHLKTRDLYECKRCHSQQSLTAGTPLHRTQIDLRTWALMLFLYTHPNFVSARNLSRHAKISESQTRRWLKKLDQGLPAFDRLLGNFLRFLHQKGLKQ